MAKQAFSTEVNNLLDLIIHSLYSHKEIFLRELISNSSDAIDKLRYLNLTEEPYKALSFTPRIDIFLNEAEKKLVIEDNGIGMNEEDLVKNLGTIAQSGTKNFLKAAQENPSKGKIDLIGQFGVGFYSAFMVADWIEVESLKALEKKAYLWKSDGKGAYEILESQKKTHGTRITLHLKESEDEFLSSYRLKSIIKQYSNHISYPIFLHYEKTVYARETPEMQKATEAEGQSTKAPSKEHVSEQINLALALWTKNKKEITTEEYQDFYKNTWNDAHASLSHLHLQIEGTLSYNALFYIPAKAPFDLYQVDYQNGIRLYVRKVFISDKDRDLLPVYLRFVRGIIDAEDLPLNVSREILQQNKILNTIKSNAVNRILAHLKSLSEKEKETYAQFIEQYNKVLKEGLYADYEHRDLLLGLIRFHSTTQGEMTSLEDYIARMSADQKAIYYIVGGKEEVLRQSPILENFKDKDIEVLLLSDEIDEILFAQIDKYGDKPFKSVHAGIEEVMGKKDEKEAGRTREEFAPLIAGLEELLKDEVQKVQLTWNLQNSPCAIARGEDASHYLKHMFKQMGQKVPSEKPILELNPEHPLIQKIAHEKESWENFALILLNEALIREGMAVVKMDQFVEKMNRVLESSLDGKKQS